MNMTQKQKKMISQNNQKSLICQHQRIRNVPIGKIILLRSKAQLGGFLEQIPLSVEGLTLKQKHPTLSR